MLANETSGFGGVDDSSIDHNSRFMMRLVRHGQSFKMSIFYEGQWPEQDTAAAEQQLVLVHDFSGVARDGLKIVDPSSERRYGIALGQMKPEHMQRALEAFVRSQLPPEQFLTGA